MPPETKTGWCASLPWKHSQNARIPVCWAGSKLPCRIRRRKCATPQLRLCSAFMPCRRHASPSSQGLFSARDQSEARGSRPASEGVRSVIKDAASRSEEARMLEFETVRLEIPSVANIISGQTHFIKTVED